MNLKSLLIIFISMSLSLSEEVVEVNKEKLPDAVLKDLDNKITISELVESKPTLISFGLACEPCKKEMKYLDEFNQKYSESGFQVISINTDGSELKFSRAIC